MGFARRVVTGPHGVASDGTAPLTVDLPGGIGVTELLWLDCPVRTVADGADRTDGGFPLEPPPGGASSRIIRMPATGEWLRVEGDDDAVPGLHATDTLDLMVVLDGAIVLGTADGSETTVRAGDAVVQRGTAHRWRVDGARPCTYWVTMLRPAPGAAPVALAPRAGDLGRRLVTGGDTVVECPASVGVGRVYDVWQTGGPLGAVDQGGDPEGPWALETPAGSVALRLVELPPGPPSEAGWHATDTIDIDVVLAGRLGLELPGGVTVELGPGDSVVQRGTDHRWWAIGDEPVRWAAVMFALT
jgi:quercetin dioxygenase-like cupin family protein